MTARSSLDQSTATPGSPTPADAPTGGTTEESDGERSEQVRTQFLRRVAHDIASPTGVTLTVLEELANGERPRPELVAMAKRSLRRLMRLSEHLALVAELETGTLEPDLASTDICALVKQAFDDAAIALAASRTSAVACG